LVSTIVAASEGTVKYFEVLLSFVEIEPLSAVDLSGGWICPP